MNKTSIEWTDASSNPIRAVSKKSGKKGWHCEKKSSGCKFCYSEASNFRFGTGLPYEPISRDEVEIVLIEDEFAQWKKTFKNPLTIFVGDMTDLFGSFVADDMLKAIFNAMLDAPWNTYQVLTKCSGRMRDFMAANRHFAQDFIHHGVSTENQPAANLRIPDILATPSCFRFVSAEPLLGTIDFWRAAGIIHNKPEGFSFTSGIDMVMTGGESGRSPRHCDPAWLQQIVDDCKTAKVKCFVKQMGTCWAKQNGSTSSKGGNPSEWPAALRVRELPERIGV